MKKTISPIKLIAFDVDDTLINGNSWLSMNLALGMTAEEDKNLYDRHGRGELGYEEWIASIVAILKSRGKASRKNIEQSLFAYTYRKGAKNIIKYLQKKGYEVALISGGSDILIRRIAQELGIKYERYANTFVFDESDMLADIRAIKHENEGKANFLKSICYELKLSLSDCAYVGDGANDIEVFRQTKKGITFAGSRIENEAWKVIDSLSDLKRIF